MPTPLLFSVLCAAISHWFGLRSPVLRLDYATCGFGLTLFKYLCEAGAIVTLTGMWLSPIAFLNPSMISRQDLLASAPEWFGWALFAWNLPFVWIALSMSVRRAASAGWSPWLGPLRNRLSAACED